MNFVTDRPATKLFTGREKELSALGSFATQPKRVAAIVGGTGSGKSTLATLFAHRYASAFPGGVAGIFANPFTPLTSGLPENLGPGTSLLLIEEAHIVADRLEDELPFLLDLLPISKFLLISQTPLRSPLIDLVVTTELWPLEFTRARLASFGIVEATLVEAVHSRLKGNPRSIETWIEALRAEVLPSRDLFHWLTPFSKPGIVDALGRPLASGTSFGTIISNLSSVNEDLLKRLESDPRLLYELTPRAFEEVVADMLSRLGYEVTLTPVSRDGGKDIFAAEKSKIGSFLYVVECKKFSPERPVGVSLVRQLHGVVQAEKATAGILATTSYFTRDAKEFQAQVPYQMSLQDYVGIQTWLRSALLKTAYPAPRRPPTALSRSTDS